MVACCTYVAYAIWSAKNLEYLKGHKHNYEGGYISDKLNIDRLRDSALNKMVKQNKFIDDALIAVEQQTPNYCHFLTNVLPQVIKIWNEHRPKTIILSDITDYSLEFFNLLGIKSEIVSIRNTSIYVENAYARYKYPNKDKKYIEHKELASISPIFDKYKVKQSDLPEKIFIERKASSNGSNKRRIEPVEETHRIAEEKGYKLIYLEDLNIESKIKLFYNAKKIATVHGAGLGNIIFCDKKCEIIEARNTLGMPEIFIDLAKELKLENYHPIELESNTTEEEAKELKKSTGNNSNNVLPMKLSKKFIDAL